MRLDAIIRRTIEVAAVFTASIGALTSCVTANPGSNPASAIESVATPRASALTTATSAPLRCYAYGDADCRSALSGALCWDGKAVGLCAVKKTAGNQNFCGCEPHTAESPLPKHAPEGLPCNAASNASCQESTSGQACGLPDDHIGICVQAQGGFPPAPFATCRCALPPTPLAPATLTGAARRCRPYLSDLCSGARELASCMVKGRIGSCVQRLAPFDDDPDCRCLTVKPGHEVLIPVSAVDGGACDPLKSADLCRAANVSELCDVNGHQGLCVRSREKPRCRGDDCEDLAAPCGCGLPFAPVVEPISGASCSPQSGPCADAVVGQSCGTGNLRCARASHLDAGKPRCACVPP